MAGSVPRGFIWLTISTAIGFVLLVALGLWQLQRLEWKNQLIAKIEARIDAPALPLQDVVSRVRNGEDIEYLKLATTGSFGSTRELYYFTIVSGQVGWLVYSPFETDLGILLVNRGFVGSPNRPPDTRQPDENLPPPNLNITGLVRLAESRAMFAPENEPGGNNWYWRDPIGMAEALALPLENVLPFFLDLQVPVPESGLPRPGVTQVKIENRHLGYVITWFGLAAALLVVYFLLSRKMFREA